MKICILTEYLSYIGGGERVYCIWANLLAEKLGHDITVASFEDAQTTFYELSPLVKVKSLRLRSYKYYAFPLKRRIQMFLCARKDLNCLNDYFKKEKFDVIIGVATNISLLLSLVKCKSIKIGTEHTEYHGAAFYLRPFRRFLYHKLNCVTSLTRADKTLFEAFCSKVVVMPNPLSITVEKKAELQTCKLVTIGSLSPQKDQETMIRIAEKIFVRHPEWSLDIWGTGRLRLHLEKFISKRKLTEKVKLCGSTNNVKEVLSGASVFLLTSKIEGFGLVLIEAMACGVPCVSFANPGPADIIRNSINGFLVQKKNIPDFIDKVCLLIENDIERKKMGESAFNSVGKYKESEITKQWELLLNDICSTK